MADLYTRVESSAAPTSDEVPQDGEAGGSIALAPRAETLRRWRPPVLGPPLRWVRGLGRTAPQSTPETPICERDPRAEVAHRDAIFRRALALADVVAAGLALLLCVTVFGSDALRPLALLSLPLVVVAGKLQGTYDRDELLVNKTTIDQAPQLFQLATLYALLFFLLEDHFIAGSLGTLQGIVL
jgi:hypothetical protein